VYERERETVRARELDIKKRETARAGIALQCRSWLLHPSALVVEETVLASAVNMQYSTR
jgi:hypothetical protein